MAGEALLDKGGMPTPEQLGAMGEDEASARGAQSLILLSKEGSPEEQRAVKAMIDATAPEAQWDAQQDVDAATAFGKVLPLPQNKNANSTENETPDADAANNDWDAETYTDVSGPIIRDGSHMEGGKLKPNVTYQAGEHEYLYQTNENGLIVRAVAKVLQFKTHSRREKHNPNTYGKLENDHAGHLFADWFGGSPELDNLVSQAKRVNKEEFLRLERKWAAALKAGKEVSVNIDIQYSDGNVRPESFLVRYTVDGKKYSKPIKNVEEVIT